MGDDYRRCPWADGELYRAYHDLEWGVPVHDDRHLFEMLILEGAQAGLSWLTILRRRDGYRAAFDGFDPAAVASWDEGRISTLMHDERIIRNRLKLESTVANAREFLKVQEEFGGFAQFLWGFVDGRPMQNAWQSMAEMPATTPLSDVIAKDLKRRGFSFVGSTIIYSYMQAVGLVNDHLVGCFRHAELAP